MTKTLNPEPSAKTSEVKEWINSLSLSLTAMKPLSDLVSIEINARLNEITQKAKPHLDPMGLFVLLEHGWNNPSAADRALHL